MSEKKPFVLRIDSEKLKALEKWGADEFRSTNGQIEYLLDHALRKSGRWKTKNYPKIYDNADPDITD